MMGRSKLVPLFACLILPVIFATHASPEPGPILRAEPVTALVDQPVRIEVAGCEAGQTVVLRAVCFDDEGLRWEGRATFEADDAGKVEPATRAPKYGTYEGVDPMGLFWSMVNDEGQGSRTLFASDGLEPIEVVLQLEIAGEVVASHKLARQRVAPTVTRREVREHGLVGTLFLPQAQDPVGAVIVLGGSGGGLKERGAALLASHGFATLALAYFHEESLPEELVEIPLEYFETALEFLGEQEAIDPERIAVQGGSRGGELALLLGATFPRIRAVVAYVPSGVVWQGCCSPDAAGKSSWAFRGEPVTPAKIEQNDPAVQETQMEIGRKIQAGEAVAFTPSFRIWLEHVTNLEAATIPVEKTRGPILFISGKADDLWNSAELAEISVNRLREHEFPFGFEHVSYDDAGHFIRTPYYPTTVSDSKHPLSPIVMKMGGTPVGNARASEQSWAKVLDFYRKTIGGE